MGNSQCKPKQGGESLKDFLSRKFNKIAKKRKMDDLVTIAIITETMEGTGGPDNKHDEIELQDLEDEITSECDPDMPPQINNRTSSVDVSLETPSPKEESFEKHEENDTIRSLQKQLEEVQNELVILQKGFTSKGQSSVTGLGDDRKYQGCSAHLVKNQAEDSVEYEESDKQRSQRSYFQTHGDVSRIRAHEMVTVPNENNTSREERRRLKTEYREDKGEQIAAYKGSMKISEGLRKRSKTKPVRTSSTQRNNNYTRTVQVDKGAFSIQEKIASLQKRDPTAPKPDKGIVWPKTMLNLSKTDKAYYTEQFMRSELFRQRCLRKYQGGHTWMNGLSPFQIWIVEHEGSKEIEAVLHPFPFIHSRRNNAQAKVTCWRGNTPPPPTPPKSP